MNSLRLFGVASAALLLILAGCARHDTSRHIPLPEPANPHATLLLQDKEAIVETALSPDGTTLATVTKTGKVKLWDAVSGQELQFLELETPKPSRLLFSPDSTHLLGSANNGDVFLWDMAGARLQWATTCGTSDIRAITFSPDGKWVAAAGWNTPNPKNQRALVKIWERTTGKPVQENRSEFRIIGLAITSAGHIKVVEDGPKNSGRLWEIPFGQAPGKPHLIWQQEHGVSLTKARFSASQQHIAAADDIGNIWLYDTGKKKAHKLSPGRRSFVISIAFSSDGKKLANTIVPTSVSYDGKTDVQVWDVEKKTRIDAAKAEETAYSVYFLPDNQTLAYSDEESVRIWKSQPAVEEPRS